MSKRLTILAVVLATILTLMLTLSLSTTAPAATPDARIACAPDARCALQSGSRAANASETFSDSVVILKTLRNSAPLFLGMGALLVSGVFVVAYRLAQP